MTVTFLHLFTLLIQILPGIVAIAIFIGTLRMGRKKRPESSSTGGSEE